MPHIMLGLFSPPGFDQDEAPVAKNPAVSSQEIATSALSRLVFGPLLFQAALVLRRRGVLGCLVRGAARGLTLSELEAQTGISRYGLTVLLDAGEAAELVSLHAERFYPTRAGILLENDALTVTNLNFVADVCYAAAGHLDESIQNGAPEGLMHLGSFSDVYQGLSSLSQGVQKSWLAFDHFYSDAIFPDVIARLRARAGPSVLDVGGNTGRFSALLGRQFPEVLITLADLPGQLGLAREYLMGQGQAERVRLSPVDVLRANSELPGKHDVIWMSQFLCCFSEAEIVHILRQARGALLPGGELWIAETFVDEQGTTAAKVALEATSLYFTCVANGKGRMYRRAAFEECLAASGFVVAEAVGPLGPSHTLLMCRPRD
jgi:SAM-dependent methyltransferase